jgi:N-acetylneuraminate lyase
MGNVGPVAAACDSAPNTEKDEIEVTYPVAAVKSLQHLYQDSITAPVYTPYHLPEGITDLKQLDALKKDGNYPLDLKVNYEAVPKLAAATVEEGFNTIFVTGTNGESYSLTKGERMKVLEAWMATKEVKDGKLRVIAHIGCQALQESIELAQHARSVGVDFVAWMTPCYFKPGTLDALATMFAAVADCVPDVSVLYYHYPGLTGVKFRAGDVLEQAQMKCKNKNIVGCKFTDMDLEEFEEAAKKGFEMQLGGGDYFFLKVLPLGAKRCFSVTGMVGAGFLARAILDLYEDNRAEEAETMQSYLMQLTQIMVTHEQGIFATGKYLMTKLKGVPVGPPRLPNAATLHDEELEKNFSELLFKAKEARTKLELAPSKKD